MAVRVENECSVVVGVVEGAQSRGSIVPAARDQRGGVEGLDCRAIRRAEAMSRDSSNAGALAFKRSGDPNVGNFSDAVVLKAFGDVPENLDEL